MVTALHGVLPVLQTPFDDDGEVSIRELEAEIRWVLDAGADGIVMGMVTEILRLDDAERDLVAEVMCKSAGEAPVVISVGAESDAVAVRRAQRAEAWGASAVMAVPPLSVQLSELGLFDYYSAIFSATSLPVIIQDASGYVGSALPVELQAKLFERYGARAMFKPEAPPLGVNLTKLALATDGKATIFDGSGGIALIETFRRGVSGTMPAADVCWAIVAAWRALTAQDMDAAYEIVAPLGALIALQTGLDGYVTIEKYLLEKQGVISRRHCRGPLSFDMDPLLCVEVDELYDRLQSVVTRQAAAPQKPAGR